MGGDWTVAGLFAVCHPENIIKKGKRERERKGGRKKEKKRKKGGKVSPDDMGCPGFSSCCFTEIDVPIDLRWVSQGISGLL